MKTSPGKMNGHYMTAQAAEEITDGASVRFDDHSSWHKFDRQLNLWLAQRGLGESRQMVNSRRWCIAQAKDAAKKRKAKP